MPNNRFFAYSAFAFFAVVSVGHAQQSPPSSPAWLNAVPQKAQAPILEATKALLGPGNAIPQKEEALIGLGVASQIPCEYCVDALTKIARQAGANDEEIRQAVAIAGIVRFHSAVQYGSQLPKPVPENKK